MSSNGFDELTKKTIDQLMEAAMKRPEDMSLHELGLMTVKDMLGFAHASPPSANEDNDAAMLEEWCQRVYSLDPPQNKHIKRDLLYCFKVLAELRKRMQERSKAIREKCAAIDWNKVKDSVDYFEPEILCFDMRFLTPKQMDALFRFIDDDPDLGHGWSNGPQGTAVIVASESMMSAMPPAWYKLHHRNLIRRLT